MVTIEENFKIYSFLLIEEFLYLQNTNESDIIEKHQVKKESFFEKILKKK